MTCRTVNNSKRKGACVVSVYRFALKVKEATVLTPSRCFSWNAQTPTSKIQMIFWFMIVVHIQKAWALKSVTVFWWYICNSIVSVFSGCAAVTDVAPAVLSKCLFNRVNLAQYLTHTTCSDKTFKVRRQGLAPCLLHMGFYPRSFNNGIWGLYKKTGFYCLLLKDKIYSFF